MILSSRPPRSLVAGLGLAAVLGTVALAAPLLPGSPSALDLEHVLRPPSLEHPLGTDGLGRDLASRVAHGARVSLAVGLLTAVVALALGIPVGALAGYRYGKWTDAAVGRIIEAMLCLPTLVLALTITAVAPAAFRDLPDAVRLSFVLGALGWTRVARYVRGEVLRLAGSDVVAAARTSGAGHARILIRHVLPAALAPVLVTAAFTAAGAITLEAALSYLGLGVRPPVPSWGGLLTEAQHHVGRAWWLALFPGVALFMAVLACNWIGEGLRQALRPGRTTA